MRIVVWQLRVMVGGAHPTHRHDGVPCAQSDRLGDHKRASLGAVGARVPRGCLLRKKGDWCWLKQVDGLTGWSAEGPDGKCCFVRGATRGGAHSCFDASVGASWRVTCGVTHAAYIDSLRRRGVQLSPL